MCLVLPFLYLSNELQEIRFLNVVFKCNYNSCFDVPQTLYRNVLSSKYLYHQPNMLESI